MTVNAILAALAEELSEEIPDVLTQEFSLATLWADLCRVAGEPIPLDVVAALDTPIAFYPAPPARWVPPVRGSYADYMRQFPNFQAD